MESSFYFHYVHNMGLLLRSYNHFASNSKFGWIWLIFCKNGWFFRDWWPWNEKFVLLPLRAQYGTFIEKLQPFRFKLKWIQYFTSYKSGRYIFSSQHPPVTTALIINSFKKHWTLGSKIRADLLEIKFEHSSSTLWIRIEPLRTFSVVDCTNRWLYPPGGHQGQIGADLPSKLCFWL